MPITRASESPYKDMTIIPTGFKKLDDLIGIGGIPTRKLSEISGRTSVGKSTLSYLLIAQAQKKGMDCLYADTEYSWDDPYAASLGVDPDKLDLSQEEYAEITLNNILDWAREHNDALIVLDSIGGLHSRDEAEKQVGEKVIGGQAKLVASFTRKVVPILAVNNIALLVINHVFQDIMSGITMTSGGWKLGYHKSLEIRLSRAKGLLKKGDVVVGRLIEARIIKNKLASTQDAETILSMVYGAGFSVEADLLEEALSKGVLYKEGQSFLFKGQKVARGMNAIREALKGDLAEKVKAALVTNPIQH